MARKLDPLVVGSAALAGLGLLYFATRKKKAPSATDGAGGGTVIPISYDEGGTRREGTPDTGPAPVSGETQPATPDGSASPSTETPGTTPGTATPGTTPAPEELTRMRTGGGGGAPSTTTWSGGSTPTELTPQTGGGSGGGGIPGFPGVPTRRTPATAGIGPIVTPGGLAPHGLLPGGSLAPPTFPQASRFARFHPLPAPTTPSGAAVPTFPAGRRPRGFAPQDPNRWNLVPLANGWITFEPGRIYRISQEQKHYRGTNITLETLVDLYYSRASNFSDTSAWRPDSRPSDWPAEDGEPRYRVQAIYTGSAPMTRLESPAYGANTYVYVYGE